MITLDLSHESAQNILENMKVGSKWVSQASFIKLENNHDVKIKQEVNLNLVKRDNRKGSSTSKAVAVVKITHAVVAVKINTLFGSNKACPALGKMCNKCSLTGYFAHLCKTKGTRIEAELAKSAATTCKNPRQCNNIQANDSNKENSDSSQIYCVGTVNKISIQHKYALTVCLLKCPSTAAAP